MSQQPDSETDASSRRRLQKLILEFAHEHTPCAANRLIEVFSSSSEVEHYIKQNHYSGGATEFVRQFLADLERAGLVKLEAGQVLVTEQGVRFVRLFKSGDAGTEASLPDASRDSARPELGRTHYSRVASEELSGPELSAASSSSPTGIPSAFPSAAADARVVQEQGWLVENIPRQMKVSVPEEVELRISKDQATLLVSKMRGRGDAHVRQVDVTAVMSLRLSAPQEGFIIHAHSPESQWVSVSGRQTDQHNLASWRFTLVPTHRGPGVLELTLSYRQIDASGLIADNALPDQRIEIRVKANLKNASAQAAVWVFTLVSGAMLGANMDRIISWLTGLLP